MNGSNTSNELVLEIEPPIRLGPGHSSAGGLISHHADSKAEQDPVPGPKIVIQGWYGNGNLGDEIILECMLAELRNNLPGATFVVISDDPEDTKRRHGVDSILRGGGRMQRFRRLQTLAGADLFILGGGELIKHYGSTELSILTWLGPLELAHEMGVPTMTYAVGVSDTLSPRAEAATKAILSKTDAVLVRDQLSLDVLKRLGVSRARLTADPAFLLPELHPTHRVHGGAGELKVSVFVNPWYVTRNVIPDSEAWGHFKTSMARAVDGLIEGYKARVRFIPMQVTKADDDRAVAREIVALARNRDLIEVRESGVSPEELLSLMAESDLVIGMRLHSLILSAALGVPAVAIEYQSKVKRFCTSIGASDWTVAIDDPSADSIQHLCMEAALGAYPLAQVRQRLPALQDLARENALVAAALISRPGNRGNRLSRTARGSIEVARRALGRKEWIQAPQSVAEVSAVGRVEQT